MIKHSHYFYYIQRESQSNLLHTFRHGSAGTLVSDIVFEGNWLKSSLLK